MHHQPTISQDSVKFFEEVRKPHRRINPCFMTGKGCVHTEHIDSELQRRGGTVVGFNVRPFQPNIETAHKLSLNRFLQANYSTTGCKLEVGEADKVRRTGYVVCEKICRRIQASDFVIVDISAPNANVFYELGLAYGIDQKILVIHHQKAKDEKSKDWLDFGQRAANCLKEGGCRSFPYTDLEPIEPADFILTNHLWTREPIGRTQNRPAPTIVLLSQSYGFVAWSNVNSDIVSSRIEHKKGEQNSFIKNETPDLDLVLGARDIQLGFETHVKAGVGVAIDNIQQKLEKLPTGAIMKKYINLVSGLRSADQIKKDAGFQEVRQKVEQSFCTIIQTGGKVSDPMAYFWLGYCHALGKNVIPVTVVEQPNDAIDDLAFDLRALWHMSFARKDPMKFSQEIEETLQQMITSDFAEWSRRQFWDEVLGRRGKVSIFTGALHNAPIGREMIGDWDLRSASELTSYFASHQYRATIESPVYQIEQVTGGARARHNANFTEDEYFSELEQMLCGKNCIVIASPDVNPLTELLLGKLYNVDRRKWFKAGKDAETHSGAVVAFKEVDAQVLLRHDTETNQETEVGVSELARAFYRRIPISEEQKNAKGLKRGFLGHGVQGGRLEGAFLSQTDVKSPFNVHAHLVIARNPFDRNSLEPHHVIILNGVSGPATFALTHVLTGGTSRQFVAYPDPASATPFTPGDFKDLTTLAVKVANGSDKVSLFLREQLGVQDVCSDIKSSDKIEGIKNILVDNINKLICRQSLYDPERFKSITLRPETRELLEQGPQNKDLTRVNRLLLEDAYPLEIWRNPFLPDSESEGFLQQLNQDIEMIKSRFLGVQYFFSVEVGPTNEAVQDGAGRGRDIFDWRRIVRWERVTLSADYAFGQGKNIGKQ